MDEALLNQFVAIVGEKNAALSEADKAPHLTEWRRRWTGKTPVVLKPKTVAEVSAILRLANETGTPIVPQGGNTGLVGGQIPDDSGTQIILSTSRLNAIREIDTLGNTITVEAGCVLETIQRTASENDREFPLALASQGSCQIGGNLSSNAGGVGALAYGVARDLCLGVEVVLADGRVLNDLSILKKDNTGYALRHLFIGAEGTLGIITAATLKLFPKPKGKASAIAVVNDPADALQFLTIAKSYLGSALTAFELMADMGVSFAVRHIEHCRFPFSPPPAWSVLIEVSSLRDGAEASAQLEASLEMALTEGVISDAVIAKSEAERLSFWHLRESISESQLHEGMSIKHDISVPVHRLPAFMAQAEDAVRAISPDARLCIFGHMGDGNLHYNISQPADVARESFAKLAPAITDAVHGLVLSYNGSVSAEHGVGQMKRDELERIKDPVALDLMHRVKQAFDPNGIMNPGKVLNRHNPFLNGM